MTKPSQKMTITVKVSLNIKFRKSCNRTTKINVIINVVLKNNNYLSLLLLVAIDAVPSYNPQAASCRHCPLPTRDHLYIQSNFANMTAMTFGRQHPTNSI